MGILEQFQKPGIIFYFTGNDFLTRNAVDLMSKSLKAAALVSKYSYNGDTVISRKNEPHWYFKAITIQSSEDLNQIYGFKTNRLSGIYCDGVLPEYIPHISNILYPKDVVVVK